MIFLHEITDNTENLPKWLILNNDSDSSCKDSGSHFMRSHMERTRGGRWTMHQEGFQLNIRDMFFIVKTIIHCNNVPMDMVESLLLKVFKVLLDWELCNVIWTPFAMKGCIRGSFEIAANLGCSMNLWLCISRSHPLVWKAVSAPPFSDRKHEEEKWLGYHTAGSQQSWD